MKYVNDLTKVKPEEIQHESIEAPVQAIIIVHNPISEAHAVVVVFEGGASPCAYTIDGRIFKEREQRFIFKPKKMLRLKPLHQVIAENKMEWDGGQFLERNHKPNRCGITPKMFNQFGQAYCEKLRLDFDGDHIIGNHVYDKDWFTLEEEEDICNTLF